MNLRLGYNSFYSILDVFFVFNCGVCIFVFFLGVLRKGLILLVFLLYLGEWVVYLVWVFNKYFWMRMSVEKFRKYLFLFGFMSFLEKRREGFKEYVDGILFFFYFLSRLKEEKK